MRLMLPSGIGGATRSVAEMLAGNHTQPVFQRKQLSIGFDSVDEIGIVLAELVEYDVHVMLRGDSFVFKCS